MKVLYLSHSWPFSRKPYWGCFIKESVDHVAKKGVSVEVVSPKPYLYGGRTSESYNIFFPKYLYWLPKKLFYHKTSQSFERLKKHVLKKCQKPDVIHAHTSFLDASLGRVLAKEWNVPLIIHARGTLERKVIDENPKVCYVMVKNFDSATKIVCVSEELKNRLLVLGFDKTIVIPNGVDTNEFQPLSQDATRTKLGIGLNRKIVLFVGDFRPEKGIRYFCEAAEKVTTPNTIFYAIGSGSDLPNKHVVRIRTVPHSMINYWLKIGRAHV